MFNLLYRPLEHGSKVGELDKVFPCNETMRLEKDIDLLFPNGVIDLHDVILEAILGDTLCLIAAGLNQHVEDHINALHDVICKLDSNLVDDLPLRKLADHKSVSSL